MATPRANGLNRIRARKFTGKIVMTDQEFMDRAGRRLTGVAVRPYQ